MSLAIWTSLHLNIPAHEEAPWRIFMRKASWLTCGIFAPELIVWSAFAQFRDAKRLTSRMTQLLSERGSQDVDAPDPSGWKIFRFFKRQRGPINGTDGKTQESAGAHRRYRWTNTHSHFVLMGGFAFDCTLSSPPFMPAGLRRLALTLEGVLFLTKADPDAVPNISESRICDYSKANGMAKTIVCLQASWFCIQCITRLSQGLGISLLELNTFAHAVCALLIYLLWWDKPLDVGEPTIIQSEKAAEICAAMMAIDSDLSNAKWPNRDRNASNDPRLPTSRIARDIFPGDRSLDTMRSLAHRVDATLSPVPEQGATTRSISREQGHERRVPWDKLGIRISPILNKSYGLKDAEYISYSPVDAETASLTRLSSGGTIGTYLFLDSTRLVGLPSTTNHYSWSSRNYSMPIDCALHLTPGDVTFLELASTGVEKYKDSSDWALKNSDRLDSRRGTSTSTFLTRRVNEWPGLGYVTLYGVFLRSRSLVVGFTVAGLAYGGVHLVAWAAPFSSASEQILWRCSAAVLMASGFIFPATLVFSEETSTHHGCTGLIRDFVFALLILLSGFYVLARLYLVIECFLELSRLPADVYMMPNWTNYWPHIA